jgi:CheY-like chemotaxis protein
MISDDSPEDAARCLKVGMDAHLVKPIVLEELFEVVDRHLVHAAEDADAAAADC